MTRPDRLSATPTILVVGDAPDMCVLARAVLGDEGCRLEDLLATADSAAAWPRAAHGYFLPAAASPVTLASLVGGGEA